jgi:predicted homoserine dehydrogenase-like protein
VISGGKARESDFVFDEAEGTVGTRSRSVRLAADRRELLAPIDASRAGEWVARRADALSDLPLVMTADVCEMGIAANHTGLMPDRPELWYPVLRTIEVPDVFVPRSMGGILAGEGVIDMFTCLRRADEPGQMGGEFIVVACQNASVRDFLGRKGLLMNRSQTAAMIYRPLHLLGVETPISVLCAALLGVPTGGVDVAPRVDLVGRARRLLPAGTLIGKQDLHEGTLLEPLLLPAAALGPENALPLCMAEERRLTKDLAEGEILSGGHVDAPDGSRLWELRRQQDRRFGL